MQITNIKIKDLKEYDKNARTHPKKQIDLLSKNIEEFGFTTPVLIDKENNIIAGHGRILAMKQLGKDEVPCVRLENLNDEQVKALRLADNQISNMSDWDMNLVVEELKGLSNEMLDLTGFEKDLIIEPDEKDDEVPETPEEHKSKLGDLYELGRHRLLCGDSTKIDDVEKLMGDAHSEMLFTSPPYADMRDYNGGKDLSVDNLSNFITTFAPFCEHQVINLGIKRDNHEIVSYWDDYIAKARMNEYKFLAWNVWAKSSAGSVGNQSSFIPITHEWIFVFGRTFKDINRVEKRKTEIKKNRKERAVRQADGSMSVSSVGEQGYLKEMESVYFSNPELGGIRKLHPATFPVELADKYIRSITNEMDNVIDPFTGSGTTLIACEKSHRRFYGMELDPKYVDVIVQRYVDYTGNNKIKLNGKEIIWQK